MICIIIGIIIIILVLILLSFLLIPLKLSLHIKKRGSKLKGKFSLIWLGIRIFSREIPWEEEEDKEKKKKEKEKKDQDKKDKFDLDHTLKIFNLFLESLPHLQRLIMTIYRSFTLEKLSLNVTMGLESPADTALFTGYLWSVTYPLNALTRIDAVITPDFNRTILDGDLVGELKLKLGGIVVEALRAFTKKPVRKLINEIRS